MAYAHCSLTRHQKCSLTVAVQSSDIRYRGAIHRRTLYSLVKSLIFILPCQVASTDSMVQGSFEGALLHKTGMMWFIQCQKTISQMEIAVTCFRIEKILDSNGVITNLDYTLIRFCVKHIVAVFSMGLSRSWHSPSLQVWD